MIESAVGPTRGALARLPGWQVVLVLVGFPCLSLANSFMPWSMGLFVQRDHSFYHSFWASLALLAWAKVAVTLVLVERAGGRLADIGLHLSRRSIVTMLGVPVVVGTAAILARQVWSFEEVPASFRGPEYPVSMDEQVVAVFMAFTAGFCEEVIYRGFGISVLKERGFSSWLAVLLATTAFVFNHGIAAFFAFPFYFSGGLVFAALFLWRRSLIPGICVHTLVDLGWILVG
jgi:uncharacterized protein